MNLVCKKSSICINVKFEHCRNVTRGEPSDAHEHHHLVFEAADRNSHASPCWLSEIRVFAHVKALKTQLSKEAGTPLLHVVAL